MNLPKEIGSEKYSYIFDNVETFMKSAFGSCESYQAFNTLQVKDYTKYDITVFDGKVKHDYRDNHFPVDLQEAFQMGERLVS
ncbi:hypothetical protein TRFO_09125 [Tritrichomonas foetus]|uniref:Uncharacterized protein n=1 Tax=Tritrichomonas foetus TaxID=1144522 RepID=A0A1J4JH12_9EUKA|nr:hypothetical protein TRFO_09125 [Tritrichomonas foetus]|eukprot:OHS97977.1 hypothetical protein TRFO_09125 [Tritrichomonas foetus]